MRCRYSNRAQSVPARRSALCQVCRCALIRPGMMMRPERSTVSASGAPTAPPISPMRSLSMRISMGSASGRLGDMVITGAPRGNVRLTRKPPLRRIWGVPWDGCRNPMGDLLFLIIAVQMPRRLRERRVGAAAGDHSIPLLGHRPDDRPGFVGERIARHPPTDGHHHVHYEVAVAFYHRVGINLQKGEGPTFVEHTQAHLAVPRAGAGLPAA